MESHGDQYLGLRVGRGSGSERGGLYSCERELVQSEQDLCSHRSLFRTTTIASKRLLPRAIFTSLLILDKLHKQPWYAQPLGKVGERAVRTCACGQAPRYPTNRQPTRADRRELTDELLLPTANTGVPQRNSQEGLREDPPPLVGEWDCLCAAILRSFFSVVQLPNSGQACVCTHFFSYLHAPAGVAHEEGRSTTLYTWYTSTLEFFVSLSPTTYNG